MKHYRDNGQKHARVRVSFDMLPKAVQRMGKDKQIEVWKKIFKKACVKYGIPNELKERQHYVKPGEKRRRAARLKKAAARGEIKQVEVEQEQKYFDEYNY